MLMTRSAGACRPPLPGAGRWLTHAVLAMALLITVVFAHGGACAAVELSERASGGPAPAAVQDAASGLHRHVTWSSGRMPVQDAECLHGELPLGHLHGTEQNCSAVAAASAPVVAAVCALPAVPAGPAALSVRAAPPAVPAGVAPGHGYPCVMRI
ncbi:hypothetical protein GCM10010176_000020 [Nonomuraea spiralis]|nr:hypothetical protein GCM10010176_000020 [Nonomuraea spiralis]